MSFPGFPGPPSPGPGPAPSPNTHNLLSTTHGDTTAASPVAGDIIVSVTGVIWERLPVGTELDHLVIVAGTPTWTAQVGSGLGDVTGPGSSIDNSIARFSGPSGKAIQDSLVIIDDGGNLSVEGNTLISGDLTVLGNIFNSGLVVNTVSSGTAPAYTITNTFFNAITSTTTGVFLPVAPTTGQQHVIKDINGVAGTAPITIDGNGNTVDGAASFQLVNDYESATLIFGPTEWNII